MTNDAVLEFDPENPFPLVTTEPYEAQKRHAEHVDAWLGLETAAIEAKLQKQQHDTSREFWIGKSVQTFSTPYTELRALLEEVKPRVGQTLIDLGAGYGRIAHVLARHFPDVEFVGYELVVERQAEAQRVIQQAGLVRARVLVGDAANLDFNAAAAHFYFLYDFGSRADVEICVENLKNAARAKPIVVIARGGRSRDVIEKRHPWLSQVVTPLHRDHYSIYRSSEVGP